MILDPTNPYHLIPAALAQNPDLVVALPVFAPHDPNATLVLRAQRKLRRLPPELAAQIAQAQAAQQGNGGQVTLPTHLEVGRLLLTVPADVAENLRGPLAERHPLYLMMVHRSFYDGAMRQAKSGIVLPSGPLPNAAPVIVKP